MAASKHSLRETYSAARAEIPAAERARLSLACCERLVRLTDELAPGPATIAGYAPIRAELDVMPALHTLSARHMLALPVVVKDSKLLSFRGYAPGDSVAPGAYGIFQPTREAREAIPDILIVPLLAFDRRGHRLGWGAGYYDATLAHLRAAKPVTAIGVGFSLQEAGSLPTEAFDQRLDMVVTEREVIRDEGRRAREEE